MNAKRTTLVLATMATAAIGCRENNDTSASAPAAPSTQSSALMQTPVAARTIALSRFIRPRLRAHQIGDGAPPGNDDATALPTAAAHDP
jgi:hypothetical protein